MSEVKLKPCPFCGTDLEKYPKVMLIHKAYSKEYLTWLHEHGKFWGSDNEFVVDCPRCGAVGQRGVTREIAIEQWNTRYTENPSKASENAPNSGGNNSGK